MKTLVATALVALSLAVPAQAANSQPNGQLIILAQRKLDRFDIPVDARTLSLQQLAQVKFVDANSERSRVKIRTELRAAVK